MRILIITSLILFPTIASAFDYVRKGFILSMGAGVQTISTEYSYSDTDESATDHYSGLATTLKIGGGFNEQFLLYYVRHVSWFNVTLDDGDESKDVIFVSGISGVGASMYFQPFAPSGFLMAGFGVGDFDAPFEDNISADIGNAFIIGGGYEFRNHFQLEANLLNTSIDSTTDNDLTLSTISLQLTLNYMWY